MDELKNSGQTDKSYGGKQMNSLMIKLLNEVSHLLKNKTFKALLIFLTVIMMIIGYYLDQIIIEKLAYFLMGISVAVILFIRNDKEQ